MNADVPHVAVSLRDQLRAFSSAVVEDLTDSELEEIDSLLSDLDAIARTKTEPAQIEAFK